MAMQIDGVVPDFEDEATHCRIRSELAVLWHDGILRPTLRSRFEQARRR